MLAFRCPSICIFKIKVFKKIFFRITIKVSNSLDTDKIQLFVGPDLDPNCLQNFFLQDKTNRQRVNLHTQQSSGIRCHVLI